MTGFARALLLPPVGRPAWPGALAAWAYTRLSILFGLLWSLVATDRIDLDSFLAAGRAALHGAPAYGRLPSVLGAHPGVAALPNLSPPVSLLLFAPLATLPPQVAAWGWYLLSLGAVAASVALLCRAYPSTPPEHVVWVLGLAGLWHSLVLGQVYPLLLLPALGAWLALEAGRPWLAGLCLGLLVAWKPQFGIWPALLLVRGEWRVALATAAAFSVVSLLPLPIFGAQPYPDWLAIIRADGGWANSGSSLPALAARFGAGRAGPAVVAVGLLALAGWVRRVRPPLARVSGLALVAALLCSPIAWIGYTLLLLPLWFAWPRWNAGMYAVLGLLSVGTILLISIPALLLGFSAAGAGLIGSLYTVGLLALGAILVRTPPLAATLAAGVERPAAGHAHEMSPAPGPVVS